MSTKPLSFLADLLAAIFLLAYCPLSVAQSDKPYSIAIMKLKGMGISEIEAETLTETLYDGISEILQSQSTNLKEKYSLLERSQMDKILDQFKLQNALCSDDSCAVAFGRLLSVQRIIIGSVGLVGKTYIISCRIVDVESSKVIRSASRKYQGKIDGVLDILPLVGNELLTGVRLPSPIQPSTSQPVQRPVVKPPAGSTFSVDDLQKKADQTEQDKTMWAFKLEEMKTSFNKDKEYEEREVSPEDKGFLWHLFITAYGEDNPYSDDDNTMLAEANARRDSWWKKTKPAPGGDDVFGIRMVRIPAGSFSMGVDLGNDIIWTKPVHTVTLSNFEMSVYEVTQGQYKTLMGKNPSYFKYGDNYPIEEISWWDAIIFCNTLSRKRGLGECYNESTGACDFSKNGFRLPTSAEWEYACRAGTISNYSSGYNDSDLDRAGWYNDNSGKTTHQVGLKMANAWGLYDMHGNVWEWCNDRLRAYGVESVTNPTGPSSDSHSVVRGGSYDAADVWCFSGNYLIKDKNARNGPTEWHDMGFRVVRRP